MKLHYLSDLIQTMLAIFPHAEIHSGNGRTRHISLGVGGAEKYVPLNPVDRIPVVTQHAGQRRLFDLNQLRMIKSGWAFIPESKGGTKTLALLSFLRGVQSLFLDYAISVKGSHVAISCVLNKSLRDMKNWNNKLQRDDIVERRSRMATNGEGWYGFQMTSSKDPGNFFLDG